MRARRARDDNGDSSSDDGADDNGGVGADVEVTDASVIDLAAAKMQALASAVHVASVLLKVDQAIHAQC
jgi:chaperonin GroEL (HSP60 family)